MADTAKPDEGKAQALLKKAVQLRLAGKVDEAGRHFRGVLKLFPGTRQTKLASQHLQQLKNLTPSVTVQLPEGSPIASGEAPPPASASPSPPRRKSKAPASADKPPITIRKGRELAKGLAIGLVVGLLAGYFAAREHLKYQIAGAMSDAFSGVADALSGKRTSNTTGTTSNAGDAPAAKTGDLFPITLLRRDLVDERFDKHIALTLIMVNPPDAPIKAADGIVTFRDAFGNEIQSVKLQLPEPIIPEGQVSWRGRIEYNQLSDDDNEFLAVPLNQLQVEYRVKNVLHMDGNMMPL